MSGGRAGRGRRGCARLARWARRSDRGLAAERAVLAGMGVLSDPFARGMLTPSMAALAWGVERLPRGTRGRQVTLAGLAGNVLWFDARVAAALDAGIAQVVVVGAGYDSRAWRFRRDGVRFFELDHRATQRDKVERAPGPGPTYVEVDLATDSAAESLAAHGLDVAGPALFILEGVSMYLGEALLRQQLADLAAASAAGSRLLADFYPPPSAGTAQNRRQLAIQRLARVGSGEGFQLAMDRADAVALVEAAGWVVDEQLGLREASRALVPPGSGLPVEAVNDHKTLLAAHRR